jgi:Tyrosyl-DNA phosphodiesterase/CUE domain
MPNVDVRVNDALMRIDETTPLYLGRLRRWNVRDRRVSRQQICIKISERFELVAVRVGSKPSTLKRGKALLSLHKDCPTALQSGDTIYLLDEDRFPFRIDFLPKKNKNKSKKRERDEIVIDDDDVRVNNEMQQKKQRRADNRNDGDGDETFEYLTEMFPNLDRDVVERVFADERRNLESSVARLVAVSVAEPIFLPSSKQANRRQVATRDSTLRFGAGDRIYLTSLRRAYCGHVVENEMNRRAIALGDVVESGVQRALVCTMMIDVQWLFDAAPELVKLGAANLEVSIDMTRGRDALIRDPMSMARIDEFTLLRPAALPQQHSESSSTAASLVHGKLMILFHRQFVRVLVSSGNFWPEDFGMRANVLWLQDCSRRRPDASAAGGDFYETLRDYVRRVNASEQTLAALARYDYSSVRASLVTTVPGELEQSGRYYGAERLEQLRNELIVDSPSCRVVMQATSLGATDRRWLLDKLAHGFGLSSTSQSANAERIDIVWPTQDFVRTSNIGAKAAHQLTWFRRYCYALGGSSSSSSRFAHMSSLMRRYVGADDRVDTAPHSKVYACTSDNGSRMHWILVGSHNLSRSAWGGDREARHYELSVMLIARRFGVNSLLPNVSLPFIVNAPAYSSSDLPFLSD